MRIVEKVLCVALVCLVVSGFHANGANPVEIGAVKWSRDLNASYAKAKETGKPVFLLFQEVPG